MRLLGVGREMEIGEQHLPLAQLLALGGKRLLHLHDQFSSGEHGVGIRDDRRAGGGIVGIRDARAQSRAGFDEDVVPVVDEFGNGRRHEPHAVLVVLDLLRHSDAHALLRV